MSINANDINLERLTLFIFSGGTFAANSNLVFNINFHGTLFCELNVGIYRLSKYGLPYNHRVHLSEGSLVRSPLK